MQCKYRALNQPQQLDAHSARQCVGRYGSIHMKYFCGFLILFFSNIGFANEENCGNINDIGAEKAGNPILKVDPMYFSKNSLVNTSGCVVLTFSLEPRLGEENVIRYQELIPKGVDIFYESEVGLGQLATEAVSNWIYISEKNKIKPKYFTVVRFDNK